ncbi:hypothetical protein MBM_00662 [Drepanopeziza brunnea f. sp. 'multigermtubi' MB_m1]|uniref:Uncharacterized protein n=1 Tax=Marssonina brunnea f. sp. multigermtubi (strain MB_m1) TaxID=1072389 RepID=K1Y8S8_MARBU|nr:uncharacterized protein MBM_00662 [Drepanopeziza brunnea f. sp. 'multigermtubi' MB_m1]EKD21549.1 hypothetical protein MBM_00662 [Drepanopeziza brunnea f. sp. 'multigermtubi' MB_m1]
MPHLKSICAILLALSFLSKRAQAFPPVEGREIIGYRTVSREEAEVINQDNIPSYEAAYQGYWLPPILGSGLYVAEAITFGPVRPSDWLCAIEADSGKIAAAQKIYIPDVQYYKKSYYSAVEEKKLRTGDEEVILEYIALKMENPKKALRFSWVHHETWRLQMVIPTDVLRDDDLYLTAICYETEKEVLDNSGASVSWSSWNIEGLLE